MRSRLSVDQVNFLNVGLMLVAAAAAFVRPFELFLFAYALLGPLHYLTEISWLHDRRYFTKGKNDYLFLVFVGVVVTFAGLNLIPGLPSGLTVAITYIAFGSALIFVVTPKPASRFGLFLLLLASSALVVKSDLCHSLFGILLPTIVHVFLFTGLFILVGALKGRSVSGISSLVVFALCASSFFLFSPDHHGYQISDTVRKTYQQFATLNYTLMTPFRQHDLAIPANVQQYIRYVNTVLYHSPAALAVMGFIAFSYTYHYLNWFSKTSIIQWHNIPRARFAAVIALWLASIGVYAYDYTLGLKWLFFLSFTHVLLEFPLNHLTFMSIGKEIRSLAAPKASGSAVAKSTGAGSRSQERELVKPGAGRGR